MITFPAIVIAVHSIVQTPCETLTTNCGPTYAAEFMPSNGRLIANESSDIGGRFLFVAFRWSSAENMVALQSDPWAWDFPTLEPDILYANAQNAYITKLYDSAEFTSPTITTYSKIPCAYIDTPIDDDSPKPTIGSSCPEEFGVNAWYYSLGLGESGTNESPIGLRFQLGTWTNVDNFCISTYGFPIEPPVPLYPRAAYCIFSCCNDTGESNENNIVVIDTSQSSAPGCIDWSWPTTSSPVNCKEVCDNSIDDNWNGHTDCDDPDCTNSPDCTTLIDPPVDPCSTTTSGNGYYCGDNSELLDYNGNPDDLVLCQNGSTVSVQSCSLGCVLMPSGQNDECEQPCTIICSQGQTRCSGNDVEVCSADRCSFVYDHTCGSNQSCTNGTCLTPTNPPPEITSVSCTSYIRGDFAICTIYGNNLDAGPGSSTFIAEFYNSQIASWSSSHIDVSGYWPCIEPLGYKQVSHRNPDYQRDDTYNLVEVLMGDLEITHAWPGVVEEGASNIPIGANGCNFGQQVVLFIDGVWITNTHLQAPDQVLGEGQVTWPAGSPPSRFCVAKYPGASIGPDKECLPDYVTIINP